MRYNNHFHPLGFYLIGLRYLPHRICTHSQAQGAYLMIYFQKHNACNWSLLKFKPQSRNLTNALTATEEKKG